MGHGLLVNRKYRGRGIGEHILRARVPIGKALDISVTSNMFTATGSQIIAAKAGFEVNYEITYVFLLRVVLNGFLSVFFL